MGVSTGFFNPEDPEDPDRVYFAEDLAGFLEAHHPDGVLRGYFEELSVSAIAADPGVIRLRVGPGLVMVNGYFALVTGDGVTVDLDAPDASPRIDSIVAHWSTSSRKVDITARKGTPAANPVPPTLTNTATEREVLIRSYRVEPGDTGSVASAARFSGTPQWSQAPWAQHYAPLVSPDFSGTPTIGGARILDMSMSPRIATVTVDAQSASQQDLPGTIEAPMMVLHNGITIPSWATRMHADVKVTGLRGLTANSTWRMWLRVDGLPASDNSPANVIGPRQLKSWRSGERDALVLDGWETVPVALRGQSRSLILQGLRFEGDGGLRRDTGTYATGTITFYAGGGG